MAGDDADMADELINLLRLISSRSSMPDDFSRGRRINFPSKVFAQRPLTPLPPGDF